MSKPEIKGLCGDCIFKEHEMVQVENANGQRVSVQDTICAILDVFVPLDGFCHMWEGDGSPQP